MAQFQRILLAAALLAVVVLPAGAQRGRRPPRTQAAAPAAAKPDTGAVKRTPTGFMLDFQEQDIRAVLSALAEAGGLNVSLNNIPVGHRVTLHMAQPLPKEGMADVIKQVSESNGLKVTESAALLRIEGPPPERQPSMQQQQAAQQQATQLRLYTYRLHQATAVQL